jgi:hypothetical protein
VQRSYKEDNWDKQVNSIRESVKKRDSWKRAGREPPSREYLKVEAEESPLIEAVTREQLMKTQQAGKDLACAVVICKVWILAVMLLHVLNVITSCVLKWSINPVSNPNPRL